MYDDLRQEATTNLPNYPTFSFDQFYLSNFICYDLQNTVPVDTRVDSLGEALGKVIDEQRKDVTLLFYFPN